MARSYKGQDMRELRGTMAQFDDKWNFQAGHRSSWWPTTVATGGSIGVGGQFIRCTKQEEEDERCLRLISAMTQRHSGETAIIKIYTNNCL